MVCETMTPSGYAVKRRGGRNLIRRSPRFSPDETSLFVISGQNVLIYDVGTAEFVKSLKCEENASIVEMAFPADDNRSVITCDTKGKIVTWKWHASVKTHEMMLQLPASSQVLSFHLLGTEEALVSWSIEGRLQIGRFNLKTGNLVFQYGKTKLKVTPQFMIAVQNYDEKNTLVVYSNGNNAFHVFNAYDEKKYIKRNISKDKKISVLAWNTSHEILAVGDCLGRVVIWRDVFNATNSVNAVFHWHHLPLSAVAFSPHGGTMITGGMERVLVAWGANNESRKFLPRLPAAIHHITACNSLIAVATADNGIQIVDTGTFYVKCCIREAGGLGGFRDSASSHSRGPNLQYSRLAPGLLLPAESGHLHLFSTSTNSLIHTIDITNTNYVHPERENLHPEQIEINEISVGCNSQWLVTWEGKDEQERIRWWDWSGHDWKLHTVAACPHSGAPPNGLCLAADAPITVSSDKSNNLRFWRLQHSVPGYEDKSAWYTNVKCNSGCDDDAGGVAISGDGSAVAAWTGARLIFWDTREGVQKTCLAHPVLRPRGRLVQFGRKHHMHYVACTTDTCLAVWNLMSLRLIWVVKLDVTSLIVDPFSEHVTAVTNQNDVFIFKMNEPEPLLTMKSVLPLEQGKITSAAFAPSESGATDFRLYFLREQQEIFVIERTDTTVDEPALESISSMAQTIPSAFSAKMAKKQLNLTVKYKSQYSAPPSSKAIINEMLLSSAAHAQPRLSNLCGPILKALASLQVSTDNDDPKDAVMEVEEGVQESNDDESESKAQKDAVPSRKKLAKESTEWVLALLDDDECIS